ncbi:WD40 repeat domain-containing protein [Pelagibaculum spongiae]|uniref:Anaphase-promoting complex subunit 4 WD40 domain-containing protein n=1 Tax=Pelagibaculum spongiae TaxID=2080658 RepID=A0A2V1H175_9GAMM|nr:hypothetical protein [Pelagibaculum spongiae]PVZ68330.1 hypothetical protein DC094_13680 [Pelagibaculum spongiae]
MKPTIKLIKSSLLIASLFILTACQPDSFRSTSVQLSGTSLLDAQMDVAGNYLVFIDQNAESAPLWDLKTNQPKFQFQHPDNRLVRRIAMSGDGRIVATSDLDKVGLWQTDNGRHMGWMKTDSRINALTLGPKGQQLAIALANGNTIYKHFASSKRVRLPHPEGGVEQLAFSPDGKLLAIAGKTRTRLWRIKDREMLQDWTGNRSISTLEFTPDSQKLLMSEALGDSWIASIDNGRKTVELQHNQRWFTARTAHFTDNNQLLTGGPARDLREWSVHNGQQVRQWQTPASKGEIFPKDPLILDLVLTKQRQLKLVTSDGLLWSGRF